MKRWVLAYLLLATTADAQQLTKRPVEVRPPQPGPSVFAGLGSGRESDPLESTGADEATLDALTECDTQPFGSHGGRHYRVLVRTDAEGRVQSVDWSPHTGRHENECITEALTGARLDAPAGEHTLRVRLERRHRRGTGLADRVGTRPTKVAHVDRAPAPLPGTMVTAWDTEASIGAQGRGINRCLSSVRSVTLELVRRSNHLALRRVRSLRMEGTHDASEAEACIREHLERLALPARTADRRRGRRVTLTVRRARSDGQLLFDARAR